MNQLDALVNARNLISDPAKWTQGALGRKADGSIVFGKSVKKQAVRFCAYGALYASDFAFDDSFFLRPLYEAMNYSVVTFNDTHTHAEVIQAFDKAIASLQKSLQKE